MWWVLLIECLIGCGLMFLFSFLGTGDDQKNLKSFSAYPKELQDLLKNDDEYKDKIKVANPIVNFISNLFLFLIVIFIFGIFIRNGSYLHNFVALLILGEVINAFDLLITDMIWFRNTKRTRFTNYPDKKLYRGLQNHVISFVKGAIMFAIIAACDGALLILF